jgi:hypothetical protein
MLVSELIDLLKAFDAKLPVSIPVPSEYVARHMEEVTSVTLGPMATWTNLRNAPLSVCIEVK